MIAVVCDRVVPRQEPKFANDLRLALHGFAVVPWPASKKNDNYLKLRQFLAMKKYEYQ
jgi:hypothetical protein